MALALGGVLGPAQDNQSRHPLIEIISSQSIADIPFDGQYLTSELTDESKPGVITHSTGRICGIYSYGTATIKYFYTDTARTLYNFVDLSLPASHSLREACLCELLNGNIGIIYATTYGSNRTLRFRIISPIGASVTVDTQIETYAVASYLIDSPYVRKLANNTYLLVYEHKNVGTGAYSIMSRTSSNFTTWAAEAACSIGGLTGTSPRYNPSLLQITTGDIFLWFDYRDSLASGKELTNVYYSVSSDNGATWATAVKLTTYATYGTVAKHPVAVQKVVNQIHMIYNEVSGALHMDKNTTGWGGSEASPTRLSFDAVNRRLYVVSTRVAAGNKYLYCVVKINLDTWTIVKSWKCDTVPAFDSYLCSTGNIWEHAGHGDSYLIPVHDNYQAQILNGEDDTIATYIFVGTTKNVNVTLDSAEYLRHVQVHQSTQRLYCLLSNQNSPYRIRVGYIDLTETMPEAGYTWNSLINETGISAWKLLGLETGSGDFRVLPDNDLIFVSCAHESTGSSYVGELRVYTLSSGGLIKAYNTASYPGFPLHGLRRVHYQDGKAYGGFKYEANYGEVDKRGLCEINLSTNAIVCHRPTWDTIDEYYLYGLYPMPDGRLVIATYDYGVTIFDPATDGWTLFDSNNVPGLTGDGTDAFLTVIYDPFSGMIYTGQPLAAGVAWSGVVAFSIYGYLQKARYMVGTYSSGWSFAAAADLVLGNLDYDLAACLDPTDKAIYGFWTRQDALGYSIKWDKESSSMDVGKYLVYGEEVVFSRTINGDPSSVEFTVSHGHLFDPQNLSSLWSIYLAKFRKLNLRFGETVSGTDYWQQQGVFLVEETKISYEKGTLMTLHVVARDYRAMWGVANITATTYYETDPKTVLEDLVVDNSNLLIADVTFPIFDGVHTIYQQWIETPLKNIIEQVCHHFGYFPRITVDGDVSARKISRTNTVDHVYTGVSKIKNYTPDDSYSDYTNRVTVTAESRDYIEVLFAEERVAQMSGTLGWWGPEKEHTLYYSPDGSRRCRSPRIVAVETAQSIPFELAGKITQEISSIDADEHYCIVSVGGPDLTPALVAALAAAVGSYFVPDYVMPNPIGSGNVTIRWGSYLSTFFLIVALNILASVGNYQFEIWACPVGKVKQTFQRSADDDTLQDTLNMLVEKKISDPLCFTLTQCQTVANYELMIAQLQRKRVRFTKIAHLQDEEGDTIQIDHPYTGASMKVFVTDILRKYKLPSSAVAGDGYFLDEIEGWRI